MAPRVETYGERKVDTTPLPNARRQASETFESQGGATAEAQARFGATVTRVGTDLYAEQQRAERERADQVANLTTLRQLNDLDHRILHDPKDGMLHQRGLAVMEGRSAALEHFDKEAGAIGEGLTTVRQRLYFEQERIRRRDAVRQTIDTFGSRELERHEAAETESTLASLVNGAIENPTEVGRIAQNLAEAERIVDTHGQRIGLGPEARKDAKEKLRGQVHVGVVERLLAQEHDIAAREYFEETRDQITDQKEVTRLTTALAESSTRGASQRAADEILNTTDSLKQAQNRVRDITDPKLRDAAQQRVEHAWTVRGRQEREAHEAMVLRGLNIAERTGDWRRIPVHEWQQYSVGERGAIQNYLEQKAAGVTVKTNPHVYTHLSSLALSPDPALRKAFVQSNPAEWIDKLSPADYKHFVDLQGKIRAGDVEAAEKLLINAQVQAAMVNEALVGMGLDPTPPDNLQKKDLSEGERAALQFASERVANFRRAVREAVQRLEQRSDRGGKPATDAEVQSIVDQLRARTGTRVAKRLRLWPLDTGVTFSTPAYAFETAQARVESVSDVPAAERRLIEAALRKHGKPISEQAIVQLFNLNLSRTRGDRE